MSLRLITVQLDAYEAVQQDRLELATRYDIALGNGDQLAIRRAKAAIKAHDLQHGTQLLAELTAA
ncbi:hypothetical protein ACFWDI_28230 [Streptomyces sp. NPDC060064]|uniref:hypothetical protein n=1 Tax=Streptomyces sp. NPDC060064 TaxID=3347049 RepID=UPI0036C02633